jgi:hypothetical protein
MAVDPSLLKALGLAPDQAKMASHGSSGFSSTFKITATLDGQQKNYFVKTGSGKSSEVMFRGSFSHHLIFARRRKKKKKKSKVEKRNM